MMKITHRYWFYLSVILSLIVTSLAWERHQTRQALRNIFHYNYQITVQDADTGEILNPTIEHPQVSPTDLIAQSNGIAALPNNSVRIYGIAYKPRKYVFSHEGYKAAAFTIDSDSPSNNAIVIRLHKLSTSAE
jgi:hypothetical protein